MSDLPGSNANSDSLSDPDNIVLKNSWQIHCFHMLSQLKAMELEEKGLRFSKGSVYAHCKRQYKLTGNRRKVMEGLLAILNAVEAEHGVRLSTLRPPPQKG